MAQTYGVMPVVGDLLRLSSGEDPIGGESISAVPFRYLVLDTVTAPNDSRDYVR